MNSEKLPGVSVIICCYNSAERLPATLRYIALQKVPSNILWELIIIDNLSSDATNAVAQQEWLRIGSPSQLRIVKECRQGLVYARQKGAEEACYSLLLFCDDDNWLEEHYIDNAFNIMQQYPNVAVLGGRSTAVFESESPYWFSRFEKAYAVGRPMQHTGIANERSYIAGAGMVIRASAFSLLQLSGFQHLLSGRKGNTVLSGEDAEICLVLLLLGFDLYYDDRLYFQHYIPEKRLSWNYCMEMISKGHALPQVYFDMYRFCNIQLESGKSAIFGEVYSIMRKRALRKFLSRFFKSRPFWFQLMLVLRSGEGSVEKIHLLSCWNKLVFLVGHKRHLCHAFSVIQKNLVTLRQYYVQHLSSSVCQSKA